MAKFHGRNASVYLETIAQASNPFTGDGNSATMTYSTAPAEVTSFGDNTTQNLPGGIMSWEFTMDGFTNMPSSTACDAQAIINNGTLGGQTLLQFGPAGSTSGCMNIQACGVLSEFSMDNPVDGAATFSLTIVPRTGSLSFNSWA